MLVPRKLMWAGVVALFGVLMFSPKFATAALWNGPWDSTSPVYGQNDPAGGSLPDAGEIDTAYHATNAGTHYFRMNLVGPTLSNSYASLYAIYIDLTPDGDRSSWDYRLELITNYSTIWVKGTAQSNNGVPWLPSANLTTSPAHLSINTAQQLEWAYAGSIGDNFFEWWGDTRGGLGNVTIYDYTNTAVTPTPIPGAVWLLGSGLLGLVGLKRRMRK